MAAKLRKHIHLVFFSLMIMACTVQESVVDSHYSFDGNFRKYKTFDFVADKNFAGSETDRVYFEEFLTRNLQMWGYEHANKKPDLMIYYSVYYGETKFKGHRQPSFQTWLRGAYGQKRVALAGDSTDTDAERRKISYNEWYSADYRPLREGTFMITLVDTKKQFAVWQGYSSGTALTDSTYAEKYIHYNVRRIMDEFRLLAFE